MLLLPRGLPTEKAATAWPRAQVSQADCVACHGEKGEGNQDLGAPKLNDKVWLYGSDKAIIMERIHLGGGGVMPYGQRVLMHRRINLSLSMFTL